ncbi:hypothetical protein [Alteromonas oceanisediminis]|uniref:hypothetical protein n=1 Tax=Alteromonas oceanisediminis TaxID=2836180 RepID=UPI001BD9FAA2|nr:hypothetical protein [Alteromonas oceanisediminis]MBT0586777.1 hypothetical protein [Alteromonas oceanisediminis]
MNLHTSRSNDISTCSNCPSEETIQEGIASLNSAMSASHRNASVSRMRTSTSSENKIDFELQESSAQIEEFIQDFFPQQGESPTAQAESSTAKIVYGPWPAKRAPQ